MDRTVRFYKIDQLLKDSKVVTFARFQDTLSVSRATLKRASNANRRRPIRPSACECGPSRAPRKPPSQKNFSLVHMLLGLLSSAVRATLRTLAELSRRTQVLIFTHHDHLVRLAEGEVDGAVLFTHALAGRDAERADPHPPFGHPRRAGTGKPLPEGEGIPGTPSPPGRGPG